MGQRLLKTEMYDVASRYRRFGVRPRMPNFGAWIDGVDLGAALDSEARRELRQVLVDFGVVFFTDQRKLDPLAHTELANVFGKGPHGGAFFFDRPASDSAAEYIIYDEQRPPEANLWHTDISWQQKPPAATIIQIQEMPPVGGNTAWACMHKAYDYLSDPIKRALDSLVAVHSWEGKSGIPRRMKQRGLDAYADALRRYPPVEHPVVMPHPVSGRKALFVNETFTTQILGLHMIESEGLLKMLFDWVRQPEFQVVHKWEPNDVAVWDNYSTQHYALADYWPARRVNQRVTAAAD